MSFEWEEAQSTEDFFSMVETEETTETEDVVEKIENLTVETEEETVEEVKEEDIFSQAAEDHPTEEEEEEESKEDHEDEVTSKITLLNSLRDRGLISYDLEEGEELTEELASELIEDGYENEIENRIEEKLEALPEDVKTAISFVLKGGSFQEFLSTVGNVNTELSSQLDMDDEENQKMVVRNILAEEGNSQEIIETQLELLVESGKLEMFSKGKYEKWKEDTKKQRELLVAEQEKKKQENIRKNREAKRAVQTIINSNEDLGGIKPSPKDKKNLSSFMYEPSVKLQNGVVISEMQKELFYEIPKNEKAMVQLGILLNNRNEDGTFNFERIKNEVETQVSRKLKENLRRNESRQPVSSGIKTKRAKALADYFK